MRTNLDIEALAHVQNELFRATSHFELAVKYYKETETMDDATRKAFDALLVFGPSKRSMYRVIGKEAAWIEELRDRLPVDLTHTYAIARAGERFARAQVEQGLVHPNVTRSQLQDLIRTWEPKPKLSSKQKPAYLTFARVKVPANATQELVARVDETLKQLRQLGAECDYAQASDNRERSLRLAVISLAQSRIITARTRRLIGKPSRTKAAEWLAQSGFDDAVTRLTTKSTYADIERALRLAGAEGDVKSLQSQAECILGAESSETNLVELLTSSEI